MLIFITSLILLSSLEASQSYIGIQSMGSLNSLQSTEAPQLSVTLTASDGTASTLSEVHLSATLTNKGKQPVRLLLNHQALYVQLTFFDRKNRALPCKLRPMASSFSGGFTEIAAGASKTILIPLEPYTCKRPPDGLVKIRASFDFSPNVPKNNAEKAGLTTNLVQVTLKK